MGVSAASVCDQNTDSDDINFVLAHTGPDDSSLSCKEMREKGEELQQKLHQEPLLQIDQYFLLWLCNNLMGILDRCIRQPYEERSRRSL